jgi:DNA-binding PadR family transcriptional regulator
MPKLPTTEYAILGLVAHRESSGYDLAQAAARGIGYIWAPSRSQIYKVLRRLEERGLVARREVAQRGKPDKALYRVTAGGRKALVEWIEDVADEPTGGPSVFLLKILFAWAAQPAAGLAQLDAYKRHLERVVAHFEERVRRLPPDDPPHSLAGYGASTGGNSTRLDLDVAAAVARLRPDGATRIKLVGASMGGTAVLVAASRITPPVDGVVSLSGPTYFRGMNAVLAVRRSQLPVRFVVDRGDRRFAANATSLMRAAAAKDKAILRLSGAGHGSALLSVPAGRSFVLAFLAR